MDKPQVYDREKVHLNLARLKTHGHKFEVVVDPDLAIIFKEGSGELVEVLKSQNVFHDAKKGDLASEESMKEAFDSTDKLAIAEKIIKQGEIQLSAEHRENLKEQKRKKIVDIIHRNAVDPKTGAPHPSSRIENAMQEAKVHVDEHLKAEDQIKDILTKLRPILPIKFEVKEVQIHLKPEHAAKHYGILKQYGKMLKEDWQNDGSWLGVIEIPGGLETELYEKMNNATHGDVEIKVIRTR